MTKTPPESSVASLFKKTEWSLIAPDDPKPYSYFNEEGRAPLLIVCDHASNAFPAAMNRLGVANWVLEKHVAYDIGAADVARHLALLLDAPAVLAGYSRLIVDVNRQLHDPSAFVRVSDGIAIPGNLDMSETEREQRIESFFTPYHEAVSRKLFEFQERGVAPAFISVHSCTPVFNRVVRQMHIGIMWDQDERIPVPLINRLREMEGVCVGDNEPYSGRDTHDFTVDFHAEKAGLPYVGIEVRQDLVNTRQGAEEWAGKLAVGLRDVLSGL